MGAYKSRFGELLREEREKAGQAQEVMAILLNIPPDQYAGMEAGTTLPDGETLKRLCMMLEWNLHETQRLIRNEMASPARARALTPPSRDSTPGALQGHPLNPDGSPGAAKVENLGSRLLEVRLSTGQTKDVIAALLNIPVEAYQRLEEGEAPSLELLRRISMVYNWNYHDLQTVLRTEQARDLQPRRVGNPFPSASLRADRLREVCRDIEAAFGNSPEPEQDMALAQLDLIRSTLKRFRPPEPPPMAPPDPPPGRQRRRSTLAPTLPGINDRKIFS
jgi:transcriptional regulator with XRE-family HTH domain